MKSDIIEELERTKARTLKYFELPPRISRRPTALASGPSDICSTTWPILRLSSSIAFVV